jgi:hypothetical protein
METNKATQIIVNILQKSLAGKLDPSCYFNPQFVADAIAAKVDFGKGYVELKNDKLISIINDIIYKKRDEMVDELKKLTESEKLLANFIKGKITAYDEILESLNNF